MAATVELFSTDGEEPTIVSSSITERSDQSTVSGKLRGVNVVSAKRPSTFCGEIEKLTSPSSGRNSFESPNKENVLLWNSAPSLASSDGLPWSMPSSRSGNSGRSRKYLDYNFSNSVFRDEQRLQFEDSIDNDTLVWIVTPLKDFDSNESDTFDIRRSVLSESNGITDVSRILGGTGTNHDQVSGSDIQEVFHSTLAYPLHSTMNNSKIQVHFETPTSRGSSQPRIFDEIPDEAETFASFPLEPQTITAKRSRNYQDVCLRSVKPKARLTSHTKYSSHQCKYNRWRPEIYDKSGYEHQHSEMQAANHLKRFGDSNRSSTVSTYTLNSHYSRPSARLPRRKQTLTSTGEQFLYSGTSDCRLGHCGNTCRKPISLPGFDVSTTTPNQTNLNIPMSFYHLRSDSGWILVPNSGRLNSIRNAKTLNFETVRKQRHRKYTTKMTPERNPVSETAPYASRPTKSVNGCTCTGQKRNSEKPICKTSRCSSGSNDPRKNEGSLEHPSTKPRGDRIVSLLGCRCGQGSKRIVEQKDSLLTSKATAKHQRQNRNVFGKKFKRFTQCLSGDAATVMRVEKNSLSS